VATILGISAYYHDSAACLLRDGDIVAAAQEERFTRVKHDHRFPEHAVRACLREAGIGADALDCVAFYDKPFLKFDRILETHLAIAPRGPPSHERLAARLALTGYNRYLVAKEVLRRLARPPFTGQLDHALQLAEVERVRDDGALEPFEATEAAYQAALARDPEDPWLHWNHAILLDNRDVFLARRGEPDAGRAVPEYRRVLQALPRFGEARIRLAEAFARLGRLDEAEAQCREALRVRPDDAQARATLAYVAEKRRR